MNIVFKILEFLISTYNLLCFVRIILTWIPSLSYSPVTKVLSKICDPYLNLFRGFRWMRIGSFDFSPAIALCVLGAGSSLFGTLGSSSRFTVGLLLGIIVQLVWSIISSLLFFFTILLIVRLIILLVNKNNYYSGNYILEQIDRSISPILYAISKTFTGGRKVSYRTALIIGIVVFVVIQTAGSILFYKLTGLFLSLKF